MNAIWFVALAVAAAPAVEKSPEPTTRLYVRTLPAGATVSVDGESLGKSDGLFLVPPGVRKLTVELDGYDGQTRRVEVREGYISRVEIELKDGQKADSLVDDWAGWTYHPLQPVTRAPSVLTAPSGTYAPNEPTPIHWVADDRVYLSYVDDTAAKMVSIGQSRLAVRFQRPPESGKLVAVEVFAARYHDPQPPQEDFHVYLLDEHQQMIQDFSFPFREIQVGQLQWHTLPIKPTEVPERFFIALSYASAKAKAAYNAPDNTPPEAKGIFLGMDEDIRLSYPSAGPPPSGKRQYDWMIRAVLTPAPKDAEVD